MEYQKKKNSKDTMLIKDPVIRCRVKQITRGVSRSSRMVAAKDAHQEKQRTGIKYMIASA